VNGKWRLSDHGKLHVCQFTITIRK
jgi:hypothetical protein